MPLSSSNQHITSPTIITIITLTLVFLLSILVHGQRDLMTVDRKDHYILPVTDKNGKQLIMGGVDPRTDKPPHPTMCYTTPWNTRSVTIMQSVMDKLHYLSPAWFQLHLDTQINPQTNKKSLNVRITGHDQVQPKLLELVWNRWIARGYVPKVTPRLSLQLTTQSIKLLLNTRTHVSIIESILELVHTGGLPRINSYKGFDGITLEMPSVWNHLPPYPNDLLSFIDPSEELNEPSKRANQVPIDPLSAEALDASDQRANDYGTYHYDFTVQGLDKHPRHIINQFVRKLGVALQSSNKSLNIVTAPYQYQQDPAQNFKSNHENNNIPDGNFGDQGYEETMWKKFDSLQCQKPHEVKFPSAFSHIDAYYLSPYVDYFSLMSYDFTPQVLSDIHHVQDLEKQTRTVATTRIGYNGKRIWRIFNGKSTVSETMFLEDYIRYMEEANEDDLTRMQEAEEHVNEMSQEEEKQEDSTNSTTDKPKEVKTPLTEEEKSQALATLSRKLELEVKSKLQSEIDVIQAELDRDIHFNDLKRMLPKQEFPMCFNNFIEFHYRAYNPVSGLCADEEEPGKWWQSHDVFTYHALSTNYGNQTEHLEEENSDEGNWKKFTSGSSKELLDSIEIHKRKLMIDFSLTRDKPWPKLSYGWSVSPVPWMKNSIYGVNVPVMCLNKVSSYWNENKVANVPIKYAADLIKTTLPKTTIMRDLVIPVKLEKIEARFDLTHEVNYMTSLRNETVGVLCQERAAMIEKYQEFQLSLQNGEDYHEDVPQPPVDKALDDACVKQRRLVEEEIKIKEISATNRIEIKTNEQSDSSSSSQNNKNKSDNDDNDQPAAEELDVPKSQLDWSFPTMQLDGHIQTRIDRDPKFNVVRVLAGMNWYGYMYIARDVKTNDDNDENIDLDDDDVKNKDNKTPIDHEDPPFVEPIAMTSEQVAKTIIDWKGQIDIRHDMASGDRFFILRDGPQNNQVRTIWYPSYRQLHRKLHNIRSIADGIAVWECGQGTDGFEDLL